MDFAARVIHGIALPESVMKTRIRRLYDIANILQSLQLIQKVQVTEASGIKKPAFQYIGPDLDAIGKFFMRLFWFLTIMYLILTISILCHWCMSKYLLPFYLVYN